MKRQKGLLKVPFVFCKKRYIYFSNFDLSVGWGYAFFYRRGVLWTPAGERSSPLPSLCVAVMFAFCRLYVHLRKLNTPINRGLYIKTNQPAATDFLHREIIAFGEDLSPSRRWASSPRLSAQMRTRFRKAQPCEIRSARHSLCQKNKAARYHGLLYFLAERVRFELTERY